MRHKSIKLGPFPSRVRCGSKRSNSDIQLHRMYVYIPGSVEFTEETVSRDCLETILLISQPTSRSFSPNPDFQTAAQITGPEQSTFLQQCQ